MARILTTHAGSLPRPPELNQMYAASARGAAVDAAALAELIALTTADVVDRQAAIGIDIANNGEACRESFFTYLRDRLTGFGGETPSTRSLMADMTAFPS